MNAEGRSSPHDFAGSSQGPAKWSDHLVAHDEMSLAVRDFGGTGPDVLLIHGAGRTLADWSLVAPRLTAGFRVVAMDLRCHGRSGEGTLVRDAIVDDVDAVVSDLSLDRPAVVGHSLGGMVAAMWASRGPSCRAVVNLDGLGRGLPKHFDGMDRDLVLRRQSELRRLADDVAATMSRPLSLQEVEGAVATARNAMVPRGVPAEVVDETVRRALDLRDGSARTRPSPDAWTSLLESMGDLDLTAVYRALKCPALLVLATGPGVGIPPGMEWLPEFQASYRRGLSAALAPLKARRPEVRVVEMDADHMLILNHADHVVATITGFLADHVDSSPSSEMSGAVAARRPDRDG